MHLSSFNIRHKLAGLAFALVTAVVVALTMYFSVRQATAAEWALQAKAVTFARLLSRETEPAVAFDDKQTARELLDAMALDPDLQAVALYGPQGESIGELGERTLAPKEVAE